MTKSTTIKKRKKRINKEWIKEEWWKDGEDLIKRKKKGHII